MIEVEGLTKYYGPTCAIEGLEFTIHKGECVGFLGLNGAGKSTTLRILAGELLPTAGSVRVDGLDLVDAPPSARAKLGYLPDRPPLYDEMSVRGFLAYVGQLRGMPRAGLPDRIAKVAAQTGLGAHLDRLCGELSLGYRKRLGVAQAILHDPALVILDEPLSGLDPAQIVQIRDLLESLRGAHTVLIALHNLPEARRLCGRFLVLHEGRIVAAGTEDELCQRFLVGAQLSLKVEGERAKAQEILGSISGIQECHETAPGRWRARLAPQGEPSVGALAQALEAGGLRVVEVVREADALERVFLKLVGVEAGQGE